MRKCPLSIFKPHQGNINIIFSIISFFRRIKRCIWLFTETIQEKKKSRRWFHHNFPYKRYIIDKINI